MDEGHLPVLLDEVIEILAPKAGSLHIDTTLGGGGHTERILEAANPDGRLLGLDADPAAIARVEARLRPRFGDRLVLRQANFGDLATVAPAAGFAAVDGCLFDLGLSSFQLADTDRGFGFRAGAQSSAWSRAPTKTASSVKPTKARMLAGSSIRPCLSISASLAVENT